MRFIDKIPVTKKTGLIAAGAIIAVSGTGFALTNNNDVTADEPSPIVQQVENHEGRITNLEGRADATDNKVNQNSADIGALQQNTGTSPATVTNSPSSSSTPATSQAPAGSQQTSQTTAATPASTPEPARNPRTILAVSDSPFSTTMHRCDYTLYDKVQDAKTGPQIQPNSMACLNVGDILPY